MVDEGWWTRVLAGAGGELDSSNSREQYVVLPRASDPRVVVDRASPVAVRDAIQRFAASRTTNRVLRSIVGGGAPAFARTRTSWNVAAASGTMTLREHLSEVLSVEVRLSVSVGPPRPNRKPVVRCYDGPRMIAVAKLGPDGHTAAMVKNESRWLEVMERQPLDGVCTPRCLHSGSFGGAELLVMDALDLESDLGLDFEDVPLEIAREFSSRYTDGHHLVDTQWWHDLRRRIDVDSLASVASQAFRVQEDPHFASLVMSAWHGDWSPWNMGRARDGQLCIWDWERATIGVPAGFDIVHMYYQYGEGIDHGDADLVRLGVPSEHHQLIKQLYLFEVCARLSDAGLVGSERHDQAVAALSLLNQAEGSS